MEIAVVTIDLTRVINVGNTGAEKFKAILEHHVLYFG